MSNLDGVWIDQCGPVCTIKGNCLIWSHKSGIKDKETLRINDRRIETTFFGEKVTGVIAPDDQKLIWDQGDVWLRLDPDTGQPINADQTALQDNSELVLVSSAAPVSDATALQDKSESENLETHTDDESVPCAAASMQPEQLVASAKPVVKVAMSLESGKQNQWAASLELLDDKASSGIASHQASCSAASSSTDKGKQWAAALKQLNQMKERKTRPNAAIFNDAMIACANSNQWEAALHLLNDMEAQGVELDAAAYNAALAACEKSSQWAAAARFMHYRHKPKLPPTMPWHEWQQQAHNWQAHMNYQRQMAWAMWHHRQEQMAWVMWQQWMTAYMSGNSYQPTPPPMQPPANDAGRSSNQWPMAWAEWNDWERTEKPAYPHLPANDESNCVEETDLPEQLDNELENTEMAEDEVDSEKLGNAISTALHTFLASGDQADMPLPLQAAAAAAAAHKAAVAASQPPPREPELSPMRPSPPSLNEKLSSAPLGRVAKVRDTVISSWPVAVLTVTAVVAVSGGFILSRIRRARDL